MMRLAALAILLLFPAGDTKVVLLKNGEKLEGKVTLSDRTCTVETSSGKREIPRDQVALVFADLKEVTDRADARVAEAEKVYHEAEKLSLNDPARDEKIRLSIDILGEARDIYELLTRHYTGDGYAHLGKNLLHIMQFLRLARGAKGSEFTDPSSGERPKVLKTVTGNFAFEPPEKPPRRWLWTEDLPPGQVSLLGQIENPDPKVRLEAVRRLSSPPYPPALPHLLKRLESETNDEVLKALIESIARHEGANVAKSLAWVKKETDPKKRLVAFAVLASMNDKATCEFLVDWLCESPPAKHPERAAFASAFRRMRAWSVELLKTALTKHKNPTVQLEILKQMGVIGDKKSAPMLLKAFPTYKKEAIVGLDKLGAPALPTIMEGARSSDQDTKKYCNWLCRKITGVQSFNVINYEQWYVQEKKSIELDEKAWWAEQAQKGYPVDPAEFREYDRKLEDIVK